VQEIVEGIRLSFVPDPAAEAGRDAHLPGRHSGDSGPEIAQKSMPPMSGIPPPARNFSAFVDRDGLGGAEPRGDRAALRSAEGSPWPAQPSPGRLLIAEGEADVTTWEESS